MPTVTYEDDIEIRATAEAAFDLIAGDIRSTHDDPASIARNRPLDDGPLRVGWRWHQEVTHDRALCTTDWTVTAVEPGRRLEQERVHDCAHVKGVRHGSEAWRFADLGDGTCRVTLTVRRRTTWVDKLFGERSLHLVEVGRRLQHLQFRLEQG